MTLRRIVPRLGAFAALTAMATGCSGLIDALDPNAEPEEAETVGVETIGEGACLDEPQGVTQFEDITRVPCADPHDVEVYYTFDLDSDALPIGDEMDTLAQEGCVPEFDKFVGTPYVDSELEINWYVPVAQSWAAGDREVWCLVYDPAGKLTGTAEGANR